MKILNFEITFTDKIVPGIFAVDRFQKSLNCKRLKQKVFYDKDLNLYDTGMYSIIRTLDPNTEVSNKRIVVNLIFSVNNVPSIVYWLDKVIKTGFDQCLEFKDGNCRFKWTMEKTTFKDSFGKDIYHLHAKMNSTVSDLYLNQITIEKMALRMHMTYSDSMQKFLLKH